MTENESNESTKPKKKHQKPSWVLPEDQWQFTKQLIAELDETEQKPRHQITQVFQEVVEIEESGGMLVADGSRRRTPGGVFFYLARQQMTSTQRYQVFGPRKKKKPKSAAGAESSES